MQHAGFNPGLASTSGIFINEELFKEGDQAGSGGHHVLFESREINMGVLETARGAVANSGFMFDWCDVAVCTNVAVDHLGEYGIDTLEQMTEIKRSVLQRAKHAVVLNADYETCLNMLPFEAGQKLYLASLEASLAEIRQLDTGFHAACLIEELEGRDWIVLSEADGLRLTVMPVAEIPATLDGKAGFNVSNAQHAICACHALGIGLEAIRSGLKSFEASFENTPGRLNIYHGLPFTVIMDYAHNLDGMAQLGAYIEKLDIKGRKILLFAAPANRRDEEIEGFACFTRKYFDHFVCRCYPGWRGETRPEIPEIMKSCLLAEGVEAECISVVSVPEEGAKTALSLARPGDLVMLSPGTREMDAMWQEVTSFRPDWLND
jgi:cyanophycin synthetase